METEKRKYKKHKQGYKISATYFVKVESSASQKNSVGIALPKNPFEHFLYEESNSKEDTFPLYIRVTFLQQSVNIKSRLSIKLSKSELDAFLAKPGICEFAKNEITSIVESVKEMRPEVIEDFSIKEWTQYYKRWTDSIKDYAGRKIAIAFSADVLSSVSMYDEEAKRFIEESINNVLAIKLLALLGHPGGSKYYKKYEPYFKLESYEGGLPVHKLYCLWDWRTGYYQAIMKETYGSKADSILSVLHDLLEDVKPIDI